MALQVLEELRELAPVDAVFGNMDDAELRAMLPERRIVEVDDVRVGMVHVPGPRAGRAERLAAAFPKCAAIVYGHTHVPEVARAGDAWILNPGSPTERRTAPSRAMIVLEVVGGDVRPSLLELP